jgi:hypothetical protein
VVYACVTAVIPDVTPVTDRLSVLSQMKGTGSMKTMSTGLKTVAAATALVGALFGLTGCATSAAGGGAGIGTGGNPCIGGVCL